MSTRFKGDTNNSPFDNYRELLLEANLERTLRKRASRSRDVGELLRRDLRRVLHPEESPSRRNNADYAN